MAKDCQKNPVDCTVVQIDLVRLTVLLIDSCGKIVPFIGTFQTPDSSYKKKLEFQEPCGPHTVDVQDMGSEATELHLRSVDGTGYDFIYCYSLLTPVNADRVFVFVLETPPPKQE